MKLHVYLLTISLYVIVSVAQGPQQSYPSLVKKYHLKTTNKDWTSWFKALHYCSSRGLRLASITSSEENDRLLKQIRDAGKTQVSIANANATKFSNGGKFYWMGHDVPISYTNWGPSQPSDTEGSENCVELRKDIGFKWNDIDCQHNRYFVCEEQTLQSDYPGGQSLHDIFDLP